MSLELGTCYDSTLDYVQDLVSNKDNCSKAKKKKTHVSNWNTLENYEPRILAWSLSKSKNSHVTNDKKVFFKASCHEIFKSNKLLFRFWSHICLQKSSHPIDTYRSVFYRIWCPKYHNSNFRGSNPDKSRKIFRKNLDLCYSFVLSFPMKRSGQ